MERISTQLHNYKLDKDAIVIGAGVLEAAEIQTAETIDTVVTRSTFETLRQTNDWQEVSDGQQTTLVRDTVRVRANDLAHLDLSYRANTIDGVRFAPLGDVYATDLAGAEQIRKRLFDRPLPLGFIGKELAFVRELVPESIHENPAVAIAANGLHVVRTLYGNADDDPTFQVRTYSGQVEQFPVLSTFHEYHHTASGMLRLPEQFRRANSAARKLGKAAVYSHNDLLAMLVAYAYHDIQLGHGRLASNPSSYDELRSAKTVKRHLQIAGATQDDLPQKAYVGLLATTFNEALQRQDVDPARGYLDIQAGVAGTDLGEFAEPGAVPSFFKIAIENSFRIIFGRPVGEAADKLGLQPQSIWDTLAIIDNEPALQQFLVSQIRNSCKFCISHQFPDGWMLDSFAQRVENAYIGLQLAEAIESGALTASEAAAIAFSESSTHLSTLQLTLQSIS